MLINLFQGQKHFWINVQEIQIEVELEYINNFLVVDEGISEPFLDKDQHFEKRKAFLFDKKILYT